MRFDGNWKGKGEIITLNTVTKQTSTGNSIIQMEIIKKSDDIFILTGKVFNENNEVTQYDIIGYYNPNTKCIETNEKSGYGITSTFIKNNRLYHRASVSKINNEPNIKFAAKFKLKKIH
jgi:hypothetical protein